MIKIVNTAIISFSLLPFTIIASPWIEPEDLTLRNDIQILADSGIITQPVTTFPLMWNAIIPDLKRASHHQFNDMQQLAYSRVMFEYSKAKNGDAKRSISVSGSTAKKRFTSYGNDNYQESLFSIGSQNTIGMLSYKVQVNYQPNLKNYYGYEYGDEVNYDGSYLAYKLGNWVVSGGVIKRWWGPSVDTSLIMSTNARPIPAISITRDSSAAFENKWLSWIGPWTFTAQMGQLEEEREIPNALLFSSRGTIRPHPQLEVGLSFSSQWAGDGQPSGLEDFWDIISGKEECANGASSCDSELNTKIGNQIAGYDVRWSGIAFDLPYAVYLQTIGEDGSPNGGITDKADLYGGEIRFRAFENNLMLNLEYTNTEVSCGGEEDTSMNCFYEHSTYKSGYRFYHRSIGSTYDNDAETITATLLVETNNGNSWQLKIRQADLNSNDSDRYPDDPEMGNTVTQQAEELLQLDGQFKFIAFDAQFTTGVSYTKSKIDENSDTEYNSYIKWEYKF